MLEVLVFLPVNVRGEFGIVLWRAELAAEAHAPEVTQRCTASSYELYPSLPILSVKGRASKPGISTYFQAATINAQKTVIVSDMHLLLETS